MGQEYKEQLFPSTRRIGSFHMYDGSYNLRQLYVTFTTDYSRLVKMVSEPDEGHDFVFYLEKIRRIKDNKITHFPSAQNTTTDCLGHGACTQLFQFIFINAESSY